MEEVGVFSLTTGMLMRRRVTEGEARRQAVAYPAPER